MIPCELCQNSFQTFRHLKVHMQFYHPSVKIFKCASSDCTRNFQLFNSYKRHYQNIHMLIDEPVSDISPDFPFPDTEATLPQNNLNSADTLSSVGVIAGTNLDNVAIAIPFEITMARLFSSLSHTKDTLL